jgi:hypothetical protein
MNMSEKNIGNNNAKDFRPVTQKDPISAFQVAMK